jgi:hypothetical protein
MTTATFPNFMMTEYKEIFRTTVWGMGKYDDNQKLICKNRNNFIQRYNIKGRLLNLLRNSNPYSYMIYHLKEKYKYLIDHMESYMGLNGDIYLLTSPYTDNCMALIGEGFIEIDQLYSTETKTFLKIISIDEMKTIYKNSKNKKKLSSIV